MWKFIDITLVGLIVLITAIISFKRIKKAFQNKELQNSPCCGCSNKGCPNKTQRNSDFLSKCVLRDGDMKPLKPPKNRN